MKMEAIKVNPNQKELTPKQKADGSNPELVKAVEELLGKPTEQLKETIPNVETKKADIERRRQGLNGIEADIERRRKEAIDKANKQIEKTNKKE